MTASSAARARAVRPLSPAVRSSSGARASSQRSRASAQSRPCGALRRDIALARGLAGAMLAFSRGLWSSCDASCLPHRLIREDEAEEEDLKKAARAAEELSGSQEGQEEEVASGCAPQQRPGTRTSTTPHPKSRMATGQGQTAGVHRGAGLGILSSSGFQ